MNKIFSIALPLLFLISNAFAQEAVDPRGPIDNVGMKTLVDASGVQAPGYNFINDVAKPTPWKATWIWLPKESPELVAGCLRKEINLADAPSNVTAWISADPKYLLYINGHLAVRGPVDIGRDFQGGSTGKWFYDTRDLAPYFHKGANVIAVEVFKSALIGSVVSTRHRGFIFEADVTLPDQSHQVVASDASWRTIAARYFTLFSSANTGKGKNTRSDLMYDPAKEPANWRLPGFDDTAWEAAVPAGDFWSVLIPSEMPPRMEAAYPVLRIDGVSADRTVSKDGTIKVVFDRALSAYPTLHLRGGKGALVTITTHNQASMLLDGNDDYFQFPFMTDISPDIMVKFSNVTDPVQIVDLGANFTSQPLEYKGDFSCSDDKLNSIWKVARWAVQINLQTHHLDSPNHQEPLSDAGDYLLESRVNYNAFAQPWLARQDLRKIAWLLKDLKYHCFHTSYSLDWLEMLMDYYDHTGDKSLAIELAPYAHGLLDTFAGWVGDNGIVSEAPDYKFMDWVNIGGFPCHHPPAVIGQGYLTAFYYNAMANGIRLAKLTGDTALVEKYTARRAAIAEAFNRELWVPEMGLYRDGKPFVTHVKPGSWLPADKKIETFSPHVNMLAVLYDLAPKNQQKAIVEKVMSAPTLNTQPWFMQWIFPAIDHAGDFDTYGTAQMRRWTILPDTQTFHEMWNGGDTTHGWCSTPLCQMSERILGITPSTPGYDTISITPHFCDLQWAKGTVPTPHGNVEVSWKRETSRITLAVTIPTGSEANVTIPTAGIAKATLELSKKGTAPDHRVITAGSDEAGSIVGQISAHLSAGDYDLSVVPGP